MVDRGGLPRNVALTTLKDEGGGRVLLRLAHLFQARALPRQACQGVDVILNFIIVGQWSIDGRSAHLL